MEQERRKVVYRICISLLVISIFGLWAFYDPQSMVTGFVIIDVQDSPIESVPIPTAIQALDLLVFADDISLDMTYYNISTFFVNDTIYSAQKSFMGQNYSNESVKTGESKKQLYLNRLLIVQNSTPVDELVPQDLSKVAQDVELINRTRRKAFAVLDTIALEDEKERAYNKSNIYTGQGKILIQEARLSFAGERYDESKDYLKQADTALENARAEANRVRDLVSRGKLFVMRYWWQLLLILIILGFLAAPAYKEASKRYGAYKSRKLREQVDIITDLIKDNQRNYLVKRVISESAFRSRQEQFQSRLVEIQHTLPVYEAMAKGQKEQKRKEAVLRVQ